MYVSYNHLSSIKKAYHNLYPHLESHHKEEINQLLHQSIGHVNNIDTTFAPYAEMFKEDF
ncbi:hypothetical protein KUV80_03790 [Fictibacillus nanhaiensis]|uniref:hypothetical protein n=1 Tax=Fictibacillus nanhaiensis TaxID=742169 RepID=UPI001C965354|nr:hypothetical protein [Fictibacillus nanhaiensis]MBY6035755.1 hypothetical protein [Fictibacillus nanhaiensis]